MGNVAKFGLDAIANVRKRVVAGVDMAEGSLFGIDAGTGKAILATNVNGGNVRAVGIVYDGSGSKWGEAKQFNKTSVLLTDDFCDMEKLAILEVDEGTYTNAEIGNKLYLGVDGGFTTVAPSASGELVQHVGMVWSRSSIQLNLLNDSEGTQIV